MEAPEELSLGSKEQSQILKGKRTKRQRPHSPIPFSITSITPQGEEATGDFCTNNDHENDKHETQINPNPYLSPATTSSNEFQESTEEEEDMANCLILLAQGHSISRESPKNAEEEYGATINYKFNSRRFMEATATGSSAKAGIYVYQCKTCNRTFPSFQALGGHRASHKKPKNMTSLALENHDKKQKFNLAFPDDKESHRIKTNNNYNNNYNNSISSDLHPPLSLQLNARGATMLYCNNRSKVHECSICGAEFTSGQALGGHMRRHRAPINGTSTALSLTPMALETEEDVQPKKQRTLLSLDLDLNLPAPDDDQRESNFLFSSKQNQQQQQQPQQPQQQLQQKQQQPSIVFSAPALVDCHY